MALNRYMWSRQERRAAKRYFSFSYFGGCHFGNHHLTPACISGRLSLFCWISGLSSSDKFKSSSSCVFLSILPVVSLKPKSEFSNFSDPLVKFYFSELLSLSSISSYWFPLYAAFSFSFGKQFNPLSVLSASRYKRQAHLGLPGRL